MMPVMEPGRTRNPPRQRATLVNSRSRETRLALIRAAVRVWSEGDFDEAYEASTAATISRAAGVSKGTFYFHFANKEAVLVEMSSATIQSMIDQVDAGTADGLALRPLSEQMMASMARRVVRGPKAAALRASALGFTGQPNEGTVATPRLAAAFESLLYYGKERGELDARIDVEDAAAMLVAVTMEAIMRWGRGDRSSSWLERALGERMGVVLRGIGHADLP
jgi:AcrR family transcriptional regulator